MKLKTGILIAALAWLTASCLENEIVYDSKNVEYRSLEISMPVTTIHVPLYKTMDKHLDFDELFVDDDGLVCIRYAHSENIEWSGDVGIRNFTGNGSEWTLPFTSGGGTIAQSHVCTVRLKSSDESDSYVKAAELNSGFISIALSGANSLSSGNIQMTIPELKKDGVAFTRVISLPVSAELVYELEEGYRIETADPNHEINVGFDINAAGTVNTIPLTFRIYDVDETYLSGYFGKMEQEVEFDIDFDFFDELELEGVVGFRDISLDAKITNWAGVPTAATADIFFANDGDLYRKLEVTPDFDISVAGAAETNVISHTITPMANDNITFKLQDIEFEPGKYPSKLKIEAAGFNNPEGNPDGTVQNFLLKEKNSTIGDFVLTVPLHIKIGAYSRKDTVKFDYNDIFGNDEDYSNNVEYININLKVYNGLPFEVTLEATAINEDGTFSSIILPGREIVTNRETEISIQLDKNQLKSFERNEVKKIILHTSGKTKNEDYVKVKDTDFLDITVSVRSAKAGIPSNL